MSRDTPPQPMLAKLSHDPFFRRGWIYERKLDGERCLATDRDGRVRLWSRSGRDVSGSFPELVEALEAQAAEDFVVDGEVVAFEGGRTSFAKLQPRIHVADPARARATGIRVWYYLFDVLAAAGHDIRRMPLIERKSILRDLFTYADPLRFTAHRTHADESYLAAACSQGWEGLVAKRVDSHCVSGRGDNWLKFKCEASQEFVIGGWTDPEGSRIGFGALLVGYYGVQGLVYSGKVGTGFSRVVLADLRKRMGMLERNDPPFDLGKVPTKGVHWVKPELVCQVAFTEWTAAGQLRHPRYLGLRRDKSAADVVRE